MYLRWEYRYPCGSVVGLDVYPSNYAKLPDSPVIVFVPGIFGESGDQHIIDFCSYVFKKLDWKVVVYNRVGYARMPMKVKPTYIL